MTPADDAALRGPIADDGLRIEPLLEEHREALRAICPSDDPVWEIYPVRMAGPDFDRVFDAMAAAPRRHAMALLADGVLVGTSSYLAIDPANRTLEIGGTYMAPEMRGTGLNGRFKPLLIERAFAAGFTRIEFRVDLRNLRSQRAVEKLGAHRDGILRKDRVTWTGHVRDTMVYSILGDEWRSSAVQPQGINLPRHGVDSP